MGATSNARQANIELVQPSFIPQIQTEDALCTLRILSPPHTAGGVEWYDLTILPGGALVSEPHLRGAVEHLTVREGEITITSGDASRSAGPETTARYAADVPHALRNNGDAPARALLVVVNPPHA
jgi:mannose-6-phosphate isomerase-like protein (cupin superfamily)